MTEAIELGPRRQWHHTARRSPTASRARAEDEATVREASLDRLAVAPGARVLDVGCWSGVVTRTLRHVHARPAVIRAACLVGAAVLVTLLLGIGVGADT